MATDNQSELRLGRTRLDPSGTGSIDAIELWWHGRMVGMVTGTEGPALRFTSGYGTIIFDQEYRLTSVDQTDLILHLADVPR